MEPPLPQPTFIAALSKAHGFRHLHPVQPVPAPHRRRLVQSRKPSARNRASVPVIDAIKAEGIASLAGIASALTERGILSPSGRGGWHAATVQRVLSRIEAAG